MHAALSSPAPLRRAPAPPGTAVLRRCACGGKAPGGGECEECRRKRLQRSASAAGPAAAPAIVHDVLRGPGAPLDAGTRAAMEPRFGHSFADVRVHAGGRAAASAEAVGAHAYTVGRDVVFGSGKYAPASADGRRLIAHELAHVVQQSGGAPALRPSLAIGPVDAPEEREAAAAADAVASGRAAVVGIGASAILARAPRRPGTEELHHQVAEAWRRENGLPPGGVDANGQQVGPTDFEITHDPAYTEPLRPACPPLSDNRAQFCWTADRSDEDGLTCRMSPEHRALLDAAHAEGAAKVASAVDRMNRAGPRGAGHDLIADQARRSFAGASPAWDVILAKLRQIHGLMTGSSVSYEAARCDDGGCWSASTMAYVRSAGDPHVFVCLRSFATENRKTLDDTLIHETAHVAGVVTKDIRLESYCSDKGCDQLCQPPENAAAWAHFVGCIGGPMYTPRTDFTDRMIRNVEQDL